MEKKESTQIVRRLFLSLLPVQAMAAGLPAINSLLDTFIVGNALGPSALAAMGFTGPLTRLLMALGGMVATGSQLLCGQYLGKADEKGISRTFNTGIALCLVIGLVVTGFMFFWPTQAAILLGASGDSLSLTADYIRGWSIGMSFSMLLTCLLPFLQLEREGKRSTIAVAAMVVVNLGTDVLNAVVLKQGVFGIGLATTYANIVAVCVVLPFFLTKSKTFRFTMKSLHVQTAGKILYQGLPNAVAPFCLMMRDRVLNGFIFSLGGTLGMSAMAIANNIKNAAGDIIQQGYSGSARMIASVLVGERDTKSLRDLPEIMIRSGWWMFAGAYAIVFTFAKPLALLFGAEPGDIATYVMVIRVFNIFYLSNIIKVPPLCVYQGLGRVNQLLVFNTLNNLVFPVVTCMLFAERFGLPVVFLTNFTSELLLVLVFAAYFTWKAKRLPRSVAELAYIPSSVSVPREDRMNVVLRTTADCVEASRKAVAFCEAKGMSHRQALYCGLCIEEMAVDTVQNRFELPDNTIDLRLIYEDGTMTILLRDDCVHFDPKKWIELCNPQEDYRGIGIRMVSKLAREMQYASALGLNVLTIKI